MRVGLSRVFGLAQTTGQRILGQRAERPFRSLADFTERVRPTVPELESLVLAGALDWTGRARPSLLLEARAGAAVTSARRRAPPPALVGTGATELLPEPRSPLELPELPEFDLAERVRGELRATGMWFAAHPLQAWLPAAARRGAAPAAELPRRVGERAAVVGLPCARRRVETERGEPMLFLTLGDASGLAECVLFPDAYRAHGLATRGQVVRVEGRVEETLGAVTVAVTRVGALI